MGSFLDWFLPPGASSFAAEIDRIYYAVLIITGVAFVIVEAGLIWFAIKYRARPGRKATYTHGSMRAEMIWTAIPAVAVVGLGIWSGTVWNNVKARDSIPEGALEYAVTVRQFEWMFTHAGEDGEIGTADDFTLRNQLHIPTGRPVVLRLQAEDVIHSLFIPAFRVKQDIVPGMLMDVWFEATQTGQFEIACAELCGNGHTTMGAMTTVHSAAEFGEWVASQPATTALR